jgi:hypothetical protein
MTHSIPEKAHCPASRRLPFCAKAALQTGKRGAIVARGGICDSDAADGRGS